ncbi:10125_t:CDS:2 [Funneliformis caledonium]|uniref:10125_t:CDS:1 n=1 Tax=Funneliformis caledonium TaxID=1117310 RepID=A0A9N8WRW6_9GLOM|nr:10125_t:CDS:2 [Funneliformis caledonium]
MSSNTLPNELLIDIFTKLFHESSIKQFLHLRTTCKQWNQIIPSVFIDEIKVLYENKLKCRILSQYTGIPFLVQSSYSINFSSYNPLTQKFILKFTNNNCNKTSPYISKHNLWNSNIFLLNMYTGKLLYVDTLIDDQYTGKNNCICVNIKNAYGMENNSEEERIYIEEISLKKL